MEDPLWFSLELAARGRLYKGPVAAETRQGRTLLRLIRKGLIDRNREITEKGRAYLASVDFRQDQKEA